MRGEGRPDQKQKARTGLGQGGSAPNTANILVRPTLDIVAHFALLVHPAQVFVEPGLYVPPDLAAVQIDPANILVRAEALGMYPAGLEIHPADIVIGAGVASIDASLRLDAPQQLIWCASSMQINLAPRSTSL